jgi:hypothetical protein
VEPEVVVISDADEEEPMEVEVKPPTPTDAPASTPVVVPIPLVDASVPAAIPAPPSSAASASTPMPPLAAPEAQEEMGWTTRNKFKDAPEDAHYHNLLTTVLAEYYPDLAATVKYYCAEHQQPVEATYWKTNVIVTAWNIADNSHDVETTIATGPGVPVPMTAWRMLCRRLTCTTMAVALRPCRRIATGSSHDTTMQKEHGWCWLPRRLIRPWIPR